MSGSRRRVSRSAKVELADQGEANEDPATLPTAEDVPGTGGIRPFDQGRRAVARSLQIARPSITHTAEVFKRAGLVMAMTAWETYVEDRIMEGVRERTGQDASHAAAFMLGRLDEELKRLHNPTSQKTQRLFRDYLGVDVTTHWRWLLSTGTSERSVGHPVEQARRRRPSFNRAFGWAQQAASRY